MLKLPFTKLMLAGAAFSLIAASPATAQMKDMKDEARDMAVDEGKAMAKDKAADELSGMSGTAADKAIDVGADMAKGKSMKDSAMKAATKSGKSHMKKEMSDGEMDLGGGAGSITDTNMSTDEMMTAGKVMSKGGSMEDAAMEVGKDRMETKAKSMMKDEASKMMHQGTIKSAPAATTTMPASTTIAVNCPSGTTAQPDGTCMITGDYQPRS